MVGGRLRRADSHVAPGTDPARPPPASAGRILARPDGFLIACRCFSFFTSLAAILCIVVNVLSAVRSFRNGSDVLEYWAGRGMLQIFVAVMTRAYPEYLRNRQEFFLLQSIASYLLLSCGLVYTVSGVLCIGAVKRARQRKEISRDQAIKDLEKLERRREELESLLLPEEV